MQNDKKIKISVAQNRKSLKWITEELDWSEFIQRISNPHKTTETYEQFINMKKSQQDELKDVGGFVAGELKDGRRKAENILNRCLVTLDADNIEPGQTQKIVGLVDGLGCSFAIYSTRKHHPSKPRLRIIIPTDRLMTTEEYEPVARKLASFIGLDIMDLSTFEASRLMYWPSCSKESEFIFTYKDKPFASVNGLLQLYKNWKDISEWPRITNEPEQIKREIQKQKDPLEKDNIIGAFCRVYNIPGVIEKYLPDVYELGDKTDKYTYSQGSVANGATAYGEGRWLYSYHATDPASRTLCNSFDLVRIHKFGHLDEDVKADTPANKYPSYVEMSKLALSDEAVAKTHRRMLYGTSEDNFKDVKVEENVDWVDKMQLTENGFAKTVDNILLILENDVNLKDKLVFDRFTGRFLVTGKLPWDFNYKGTKRDWDDSDEACLRNYLSRKPYKIEAPKKVEDALFELTKKKSIHVVQDYFNSLRWDGLSRLDTLLIDYLGAEDTAYTRAVIRKELVAAVARVMTEKPVKFDNMIILTGKQGIGKSTFLDKLGHGWFSDNVKDFNNKDTLLQMQKCLIIEIGELQAFNKTDINTLKQFMSQKTDTFRAPYAKKTIEHPRHCVFFGTTNESEFLKDKTGNRRYWPVECMIKQPTKNIFKELTEAEIDQIWAEAIYVFRCGSERLYLEGEAEKEALAKQELHLESHPWEGPIREFINQKVTRNWLQIKIITRKNFGASESDELIERDRICAAEIWCECLNNDLKNMKISDTKTINSILGSIKFDDKKLVKESLYFGTEYGKQRGFKIYNRSNCLNEYMFTKERMEQSKK